MRYLWKSYHEDGTIIEQPEDDRYSKHDDSVDWNPSAFRDVQDQESPVRVFQLLDSTAGESFSVNLKDGLFNCGRGYFSLENTPLKNRKLIYFREVEQAYENGQLGEANIVRYAIGYEGKNIEGKIEKKVIYINGAY